MRKKANTVTVRGATWSALDKIIISPLASKVKHCWLRQPALLRITVLSTWAVES